MQPELIAGRYRVLRVVGRGGMGAVWLCRDEVLHREVAVKQIEGLEEEPTTKAARPLREARLAAALNHENAVSMFDIVEDHGSTWLVMEYVPSRTLAEILRAEGRLPVDRVVRIGAQLAAALTAAHALGIIHRDIKPGNVLVGENDLAKISDFGIARGHHDPQLTLTGFITGTPAYFSPELARGGDPSQASDVWALGATLYATVEGGPPHGKGSNPLALLTRIASQPPPRPTHAGPLTSTLASMLDPNPETRASMAAVVDNLRQLVQPAGVDAARGHEEDQAYADTTVHDLRAGFLQQTLEDARPPAADEQPTIVTATPEHAGVPEPLLVPERRAAPEDRPAVDPHAHLLVPQEVLTNRSDRGRPSLRLLIVGLAALLALLVAGSLLWALLPSPAGNHTSSSAGSGGRTEQTPATNGTHHPTTPAQSTATGSAPTTPTSTENSAPPPPPTGQGPASFVASYYRLVPQDLKSGWQELAPSMRRIGRDSYQRFWRSIDSVDLADVHRVSDGAVVYQITYHFTDGRVVREEQRIDLTRHGPSFRITDDTVLRSTTLHP